MNPYNDIEKEMRRLREISMRTGIPMIVRSQKEADIASEVTREMSAQSSRRSAVMVDYLVLMSNPCSEVSARGRVNPHDSLRAGLHGHPEQRCSALCDPGHEIDPKERTPHYVDTMMWDVLQGPSAKEMRNQ